MKEEIVLNGRGEKIDRELIERMSDLDYRGLVVSHSIIREIFTVQMSNIILSYTTSHSGEAVD